LIGLSDLKVWPVNGSGGHESGLGSKFDEWVRTVGGSPSFDVLNAS
jgi:hypothetical protein